MKRFNIKDAIVFENDDFIAINKPPLMSSLHERVADGSSVLEHLEFVHPNYQLCHRIDKETSGVLLIAKHPNAYRHAAGLFEKRKIKKFYHAISTGFHQFQDFKLDIPLVTTRSGRSGVNSIKGKSSVTIFNTLEHFAHYTLVEAQPITGRLHQIRIHLATQNAVIAADTAYGGKFPYLSQIKRNFSIAKEKEENPIMNRVALHARALVFKGLNEEDIAIEAPYPKDFEVFLKLLRKYDASTYSS